MRSVIAGTLVGLVTAAVWFNRGALTGFAFLLWSCAVYGAGAYEGATGGRVHE